MSISERLYNAFLKTHPVDAARVLEAMPVDELGRFLAGVQPASAAKSLEHLAPPISAACLGHMVPAEAGKIVAAFHLDFQIAALRQMTSALRRDVLDVLEPELAGRLEALLNFPEGTIGDLMDPIVCTLPDDILAEEGRKRVRKTERGVRFYIYVVDRQYRLVGVLTLHELLCAPSDARVSSLMKRDVVRLYAASSRQEMVKNPYWRELNTLPVVDEDDIFLGMIRHQTLARVRDELLGEEREGALDTMLALGELYWSGMSGVLDVVASNPTAGGRDGN